MLKGQQHFYTPQTLRCLKHITIHQAMPATKTKIEHMWCNNKHQLPKDFSWWHGHDNTKTRENNEYWMLLPRNGQEWSGTGSNSGYVSSMRVWTLNSSK